MDNMDKAIQLLEALLNKETVKRFDVFRNRYNMWIVMDLNPKYRGLKNEVDLIVDMAQESL